MKKYSLLFALSLGLTALVSAPGTYAEKPAKDPKADIYMKAKQDVPPPDTDSITGKISETMNSGGYTYICIDKDGKKTWVAIPETKVSVGDDISLPPGYEMINFTSKTLNRTFDKIIFTTGPSHHGAHGAPGASDKMGVHGGSMGAKSAETTGSEIIKVEKASGPDAYTVAELFEKCAELNNKNVAVKGKVVKVSAGIMGKNWLHLRDGSGTAKDSNNDITVTTQDIANVGDVVTANGVLFKDKDFGSGYKYNVIVEEASIKK